VRWATTYLRSPVFPAHRVLRAVAQHAVFKADLHNPVTARRSEESSMLGVLHQAPGSLRRG
jgi:hypothetical protein